MAETTKREYTPSEEVLRAKKAWEQQDSEKPGAYVNNWQSQMDEAMNRILNREDFSYSLNGDALYRQYRDQALRSGRMAMMDTMGQAAALTGGYANSYAQGAAQQAYQQELTGLNDRIPQLYALALDQYTRQGQALQQRYDLLAGREAGDYSRYQDALAAWQQDADRRFSQYGSLRDFDYGAYRDLVADDQWLAEFMENIRRYDQEWAAAHPAYVPSSGGGSGKAQDPYQKALQESKEMIKNGATSAQVQNYLSGVAIQGKITAGDTVSITKKVSPNTKSK